MPPNENESSIVRREERISYSLQSRRRRNSPPLATMLTNLCLGSVEKSWGAHPEETSREAGRTGAVQRVCSLVWWNGSDETMCLRHVTSGSGSVLILAYYTN